MTEPAREPRFVGMRASVAQLMVAVGLLAIVLGALRASLAAWAGLNLLFLGVIVLSALYGHGRRPCPGCGQRTLRRLASVPFGPRYCRCMACARPWKRRSLGPWRPANDKEDAAILARRDREGRWEGAPVVVTEEGAQGQLLRFKREHEADHAPDPEAATLLADLSQAAPLAPSREPDPWTDPADDPARLEVPGRLLEGQRRRRDRSRRGHEDGG